MKNNLLFLILLFCASGLWGQVYYGTPFYKEGFDNAEVSATGWVQEGTLYTNSGSTSTTSAWTTTNVYSDIATISKNKNFNRVDGSSTHSLLGTIAMNTGLTGTITSPEVVNTEVSYLCVGFTAFNPSDAFPTGYGYLAFQTSCDGGATWDVLWRSDGQATGFPYKEINLYPTYSPYNGWRTIMVNLPASYDKKNFKFRFYVNSPDIREGSVNAMELFIDAVFASKRRDIDVKIETMTGYGSSNTGAYFNVPVKINFTNEGATPISSLDLSYTVLPTGQTVTETYTPATPIVSDQTVEYTFSVPADLSGRRTNYTMALKTILEGDENTADNDLSVTFNNVMTDVPYVAKWMSTSPLGDNWSSVQEGAIATVPYWTVGVYGDDSLAYCEATNRKVDGDTYYFSRPILLKQGKKYQLRFDAFTSSATDIFTLQLFMATRLDTTARIGNALLYKADVDNSKYLYQSFVIEPVKDTSYYFVFRALTTPGNVRLYLRDFEIAEMPNIDARMISLLTPANKDYEFDSQQAITVKVANTGQQAIAANALKVSYQLDEGAIVTETLSKGLAVNEQIDYTFTAKANMAAIGRYRLKHWVSLSNDEYLLNDTLTSTLNTLVTTLPYDASLGENSSSRTFEEGYWTAEVWTISASASLNRWQVNCNTANLEANLYSRPIRLKKGAVTSMSFLLARSRANAVDLQLKVYKKEHGAFVQVDSITTLSPTAAANAYESYTVYHTAAEAGDYYFGFIVRTTAKVNTIFYLHSINFRDGYNRDLMIEDILLPGLQVAGLDSLPIGAIIQNRGAEQAEVYQVAYQLGEGAVVTESVGMPLAKGESIIHYFKDKASFAGAGEESVKVWVVVEGDENSANNERGAMIENIAAASVPYNITSFTDAVGWLVLDENRDGNRWGKLTGSITGYKYASGNEADDYLLSRQVTLEAGKTYKVSFEALAETAERLFNLGISYGKANHVANLTSVATYNNIGQTASGSPIIAYIQPTEAANYAVGFHVEGNTNTVQITNAFSVVESAGLPDAAVSIAYPVEDAVFTDKETIKIAIKNNGLDAMAGFPLTVKLNGEVIHTAFLYTQIKAGETYEYTVNDIDMYEAKEYKVEAWIESPFDSDQSNNSGVSVVNGISQNDIQLVEIVSPASGKTNAAAEVVILIKNEGNYPVSNIEATYKLNGVEISETIATAIDANATYEYTFAQKLDISVPGAYDIAVSVEFINDTDAGNNHLTKTVHVTSQTIDIAVTGLVAPVSGVLTNEEVITVAVTNNTPIPLIVPLSYRIDNGVVVEEPLEMEASSAVNFSFSKTAAMSEVKSYTIVVTAALPIDEVAENNSITKTVEYIKNDIGISRIQSPTNYLQLSASTPVIVEIRNYGTTSVSETSVSYLVDAGQVVTETVSFQPALAPDGVYEYTFKQKADMSAQRDYTLAAYTTWGEDTFPENDRTEIVITNDHQEYGDILNPVTVGSAMGMQSFLQPDGKLTVTYWINAGGQYNQYMQILDQKGTPLLMSPGTKVTNNKVSFSIVNAATIDKEGNFISGFTNIDRSTGTSVYDVRISKISPEGKYLFGEYGVAMDPANLYVSAVRIDSKGYIYVASGGQLYKMDKETGSIIASIEQSVSTMEFDGQDNLCVVYNPSEASLAMKIFDTNLDALTHPVVITESGARGASIMKFDTENSIETGIWVCYESIMHGGSMYVQYVDGDLAPQLGDRGVAVSTTTARYPLYGWPAVIRQGENSLAFITSETVQGGVVYYYLKGQIITKNGEVKFGEEGKDIIAPIQGAGGIRALGLTYRDKQLYLTYNYYQGSGSTDRTHGDITICDLNFDIEESFRFATSVLNMSNISVNFDAYGTFVSWVGNGTTNAQHIYYDGTLANKQHSVKVVSADYSKGYVTGGGLLNAGDEAVMQATPVPGFFFKEWQVNGEAVSASNPYRFSVTGDVTVTAIFTESMDYEIVAYAGANGSITPSGTITVAGGSDQAFTITPDNGYVVDQVLVDGTSVGAVTSYAFKNVTNNHTIKATFKQQQGIGNAGVAELRAFPNPTTGQLSITNGESRINSIQVFDVTGRLLMEMNNINNTEAKVNLSAYAAGSYFVEVDGKTMKVMKQ